MKIEDAIKRYESWAEDDRIDVLIRKEHRQVADWLKELKADRPQGEWIDDIEAESNGYYWANCSQCGMQIDVHENRGYYNYCPNCGADMRKGTDNER